MLGRPACVRRPAGVIRQRPPEALGALEIARSAGRWQGSWPACLGGRRVFGGLQASASGLLRPGAPLQHPAACRRDAGGRAATDRPPRTALPRAAPAWQGALLSSLLGTSGENWEKGGWGVVGFAHFAPQPWRRSHVAGGHYCSVGVNGAGAPGSSRFRRGPLRWFVGRTGCVSVPWPWSRGARCGAKRWGGRGGAGRGSDLRARGNSLAWRRVTVETKAPFLGERGLCGGARRGGEAGGTHETERGVLWLKSREGGSFP